MIRQTTIGRQLMLPCAVCLILALVLGGAALHNISQLTLDSASGNGTAVISILLGLTLLCGASVAAVTIRGVKAQLREIAGILADCSSHLASAARQVSSASQILAQGATEQAAALEQTSASSEQLTSMTRKNSENAQIATELMGGVDCCVADANRTLEMMVASMNEIGASSDKISRIIRVIDEIAFQTNILALNAAVEAARAGEAGMGFAVVADEVRNLAQRSAQSARDTAQLIEESIKRSQEGRLKLGQVVSAIQSITEGSAKVKTLADEVNLGGKEQTRGIEQIAKAILQMEKVTQTSAVTAEQAATNSQELTAMAETMRSTVLRLEQLIGSENHKSGPHNVAKAVVKMPKVFTSEAAPPCERQVSPKFGHANGQAKVSRMIERPTLAVRSAEEEFPLDDDFRPF